MRRKYTKPKSAKPKSAKPKSIKKHIVSLVPPPSDLEQFIADVVTVHRSIWSPLRGKEENIDLIQHLSQLNTKCKWFINNFVDVDQNLSMRYIVAVSYVLINNWTMSEIILERENIPVAIDNLYERSKQIDENFDGKIKKIKESA